VFSGCVSGVDRFSASISPTGLLLRLDRPDRLNALDSGLLAELVELECLLVLYVDART
jgi:hypothetical protein